MKEYDVLVIGSGLSGLFSALLLAKAGKSVCVLEKNQQYGGNLQTFIRKNTLFDTGVHYIGSLAEGEVLYEYFKDVGIADCLSVERLDINGYDRICFGDTPNVMYPHAQGYENFVQQLLSYFPNEKKALEEYAHTMQSICDKFPLYRHKQAVANYDVHTLSLKLLDFLNSITNNERLKAVLLGSNFLYGGTDEQTPLYVHALTVNSYIESAWRLTQGGSQITDLLIEKLRQYGVDLFNQTEVAAFEYTDGNTINTVISKQGGVFKAKQIISAIDIKQLLNITGKAPFKPSFYKRVQKLQPTVAPFSLHLILKPNKFAYLSYNIYWFKDNQSVYQSGWYPTNDFPLSYMLSMNPPKDGGVYTDNITLLTYMNADELHRWQDSFATNTEGNGRGSHYELFKRQRAMDLLDVVALQFPALKSCITDYYTSTPLTYRDYIGSPTGALYGYKKNANHIMESVFMPQTHIKNLYVTGQSVGMHGLVGVTISAVLTYQILMRSSGFL
nr:NAD(P)/FAD-dependent oxidoreductase [uncultured Capnocytophaga sp.]